MNRATRRAFVYAGCVALIAVAGWWSYARARFDGQSLLIVVGAGLVVVALMVLDYDASHVNARHRGQDRR